MILLTAFPLDPTSFLVPLLIGLAFGYTLESSGFGDARRLAAQFYFTEMRVLKVMFTAIVTCMLLLAWFAAFGWLDLGAIFVNPTYLASGILGGFVLGLGFIVGGYCPGTSLVSAATLKIDGAIFVGGVALGSFVFGETADGFRPFYDNAGDYGRLTLPEWLGLPTGVVVLLVVLMAGFMFWGGELLERMFGPRDADQAPRARGRFWRPAVKGGAVALVVFLVLALALPAVGQPTIEEKVEAEAGETQPILTRREVHVDPLELLGLMHGQVQGKLGRFRLVLLDVRRESDFNLFHLVDARRVTLEALKGPEGRALRGPDYAAAIFVLMSSDEHAAEEAWRILRAQGVRNHYVLAGGVNLWLDVFRDGKQAAEAPRELPASEAMRHDFGSALGDRHPFARPAIPVLDGLMKSGARSTAWKVKPVVKASGATGGCG